MFCIILVRRCICLDAVCAIHLCAMHCVAHVGLSMDIHIHCEYEYNLQGMPKYSKKIFTHGTIGYWKSTHEPIGYGKITPEAMEYRKKTYGSHHFNSTANLVACQRFRNTLYKIRKQSIISEIYCLSICPSEAFIHWLIPPPPPAKLFWSIYIIFQSSAAHTSRLYF